MAKDVRKGLSSEPKDLSPWPKYLYDAEGSRLFEEITHLPEYYQTRAERSILERRAEEMVRGVRELVELGAGSATKTRALLRAMLESNMPASGGIAARYVPLDVSESALREGGERLLRELPGLRIEGYVGDFDRSLGRLLDNPESGGDGGRLVAFLGGTIGNFEPERRRRFLRELRAGLHSDDRVLIGVDLVKDARVLVAAYDDAAGVTARFNKNLLQVINERLGGRFEPDLFDHRAVYNAGRSRIEMWLDSREEQLIPIEALRTEVRFHAGEGMRTEISAKFTAGSVVRTFEEADLRLLRLYTDDNNLFGLAFGAPGD